MKHALVNLVAGTGLIVACTSDAAHRSSPTNDTIVRTTGAASHPGGGLLIEELSIGAADGPPEYAFAQLATLFVARDSTIWAVDRPFGGTAAIRRYDASGQFIGTVGRAGDGPGEYRSPAALGQLPDGRMLLCDFRTRRMNVYTESGAPLATWRVDLSDVECPRMVVDTGGIVYLRATGRPRTMQEEPPEMTIRVASDGTVIDTLAVPGLPPYQGRIDNGATREQDLRVAAIPYVAASHWTWSPLGYMVTGHPSRYAVELLVPLAQTRSSAAPPLRPSRWARGDPVISIRRTVGPVEVTEAERSAHRAAITEYMRGATPTWRWTGPDVPRVKPAYRTIAVGRDGRIWLNASVPSERFTPPQRDPLEDPRANIPWQEPSVFDVFEPDGEYLGRITTPDRVYPRISRGESVWTIVRDTNDVSFIKRYRIVWR